MAEKPDVSVIIVNWNTRDLVLRCIRSVIETRGAYGQEIIVVDNASSDGSAEAIENDYPDVLVVRNAENLGFARANNIGIKKSRGRYICLVNSDVQVLDGTIKYLLEYMEKNTSVGVVGPTILWPDMTLQDSCRRFPTLWTKFCETFALHRIFPHSALLSGEQMAYFAHDRITMVESLAGCFLMIRRDALEEVGLFDEQYFIYSEETDLCKRFREAGWQILFLPDVSAIHNQAASSAKDPVKYALLQQQSLLKYWRKHHSRLSLVCLYLLLMTHHSLRYAWASMQRTLSPSKRENASKRIEQHRRSLKALFISGSSPS